MVSERVIVHRGGYNNQDKGISHQHWYRYPLLSAKVTCGMDPEQLVTSSHFSEEGGQHKNENIRGFMETRQADVFAEIATLLGIESANASTPGWFNQHMPAIGNILAKMMMADREELEKECERFELEGNNEQDK